MGAPVSSMIHKLQAAINERFGAKLVISRNQWYSYKQDRPITTYVIKQAHRESNDGPVRYDELFRTTSKLQIVLYLRDYWYELNGWEVPTSNKEWQRLKEQRKISFMIQHKEKEGVFVNE